MYNNCARISFGWMILITNPSYLSDRAACLALLDDRSEFSEYIEFADVILYRIFLCLLSIKFSGYWISVFVQEFRMRTPLEEGSHFGNSLALEIADIYYHCTLP